MEVYKGFLIKFHCSELERIFAYNIDNRKQIPELFVSKQICNPKNAFPAGKVNFIWDMYYNNAQAGKILGTRMNLNPYSFECNLSTKHDDGIKKHITIKGSEEQLTEIIERCRLFKGDEYKPIVHVMYITNKRVFKTDKLSI